MTELSQIFGMDRRQLHRHIKRAEITGARDGKRRLYEVTEVAGALLKARKTSPDPTPARDSHRGRALSELAEVMSTAWINAMQSLEAVDRIAAYRASSQSIHQRQACAVIRDAIAAAAEYLDVIPDQLTVMEIAGAAAAARSKRDFHAARRRRRELRERAQAASAGSE